MKKTIIKITTTTNEEFLVVTKSLDKACQDLLNYFEQDNSYAFKRKIKDIEIIAEKVDNDEYSNIYEI